MDCPRCSEAYLRNYDSKTRHLIEDHMKNMTNLLCERVNKYKYPFVGIDSDGTAHIPPEESEDEDHNNYPQQLSYEDDKSYYNFNPYPTVPPATLSVNPINYINPTHAAVPTFSPLQLPKGLKIDTNYAQQQQKFYEAVKTIDYHHGAPATSNYMEANVQNYQPYFEPESSLVNFEAKPKFSEKDLAYSENKSHQFSDSSKDKTKISQHHSHYSSRSPERRFLEKDYDKNFSNSGRDKGRKYGNDDSRSSEDFHRSKLSPERRYQEFGKTSKRSSGGAREKEVEYNSRSSNDDVYSKNYLSPTYDSSPRHLQHPLSRKSKEDSDKSDFQKYHLTSSRDLKNSKIDRRTCDDVEIKKPENKKSYPHQREGQEKVLKPMHLTRSREKLLKTTKIHDSRLKTQSIVDDKQTTNDQFYGSNSRKRQHENEEDKNYVRKRQHEYEDSGNYARKSQYENEDDKNYIEKRQYEYEDKGSYARKSQYENNGDKNYVKKRQHEYDDSESLIRKRQHENVDDRNYNRKSQHENIGGLNHDRKRNYERDEGRNYAKKYQHENEDERNHARKSQHQNEARKSYQEYEDAGSYSRKTRHENEDIRSYDKSRQHESEDRSKYAKKRPYEKVDERNSLKKRQYNQEEQRNYPKKQQYEEYSKQRLLSHKNERNNSNINSKQSTQNEKKSTREVFKQRQQSREIEIDSAKGSSRQRHREYEDDKNNTKYERDNERNRGNSKRQYHENESLGARQNPKQELSHESHRKGAREVSRQYQNFGQRQHYANERSNVRERGFRNHENNLREDSNHRQYDPANDRTAAREDSRQGRAKNRVSARENLPKRQPEPRKERDNFRDGSKQRQHETERRIPKESLKPRQKVLQNEHERNDMTKTIERKHMSSSNLKSSRSLQKTRDDRHDFSAKQKSNFKQPLKSQFRSSTHPDREQKQDKSPSPVADEIIYDEDQEGYEEYESSYPNLESLNVIDEVVGSDEERAEYEEVDQSLVPSIKDRLGGFAEDEGEEEDFDDEAEDSSDSFLPVRIQRKFGNRLGPLAGSDEIGGSEVRRKFRTNVRRTRLLSQRGRSRPLRRLGMTRRPVTFSNKMTFVRSRGIRGRGRSRSVRGRFPPRSSSSFR